MARDVNYMVGRKRLLEPPAKRLLVNIYCSFSSVGTDCITSNLRPRRKFRRKQWNSRDVSPQRERHEAFVVMFRHVEVAKRPLQIYNIIGRGLQLVSVSCVGCVIIVVRVRCPKAVLPPEHH